MRLMTTITGFMNFLFGLVEGLLGLRVVLKLFGANAAAPFVDWVYEVTAPLLQPFSGAFPAPSLSDGLVIEFTALFAMLVYALVTYLLLELVAQVDLATSRRLKATPKHKRGN